MKSLVLYICFLGFSLTSLAQSVALDTRPSTGTGSWTTRQAKLVNLLLGNALITNSSNLDVNKYGSTNQISSVATGFFYTKKVNGRWWIIDPEGKAGFNIAVNSVPKNTDDTKLGQSYDKLWELGFNGIGNFLDDESQTIRYNNLNTNKFSYTRRINFHGTYAYKRDEYYPATTPSSSTILNYVFVFDPAFVTYCESRAKTFGDAYKNEPNLLGYFLDNELPFHSDQLLRFLRDLAPGDPCYDAAAEFATIKGLTVSQVVSSYSSVSSAIKDEFSTKVADKYYEIVTTAIKKYDPNHLTLGSRLHGGSRAMEGIVKASAKWCDVVSVNFYDNYSPDNQITSPTKYLTWIDKPCLVGEFYTKGYDTYEQGIVNGFSGAGWVVRTQTDRGNFYQNTCLELIASRLFVGWHYFKYYDDSDSNKGMFKRPSGEEYTNMTGLMKMMNINRFKTAEFYDKANATVTWSGQAGDGKWSTPSNWDSNTLPAVSDNVVIPDGVTVNLSEDAGTINKITVNGKLIITESGSLKVEQTTSSAPLVNITGGELVNAGELFIIQRLNNSNTVLQLSDNAERDSKFSNSGLLTIDNTVGSYTSTTGRCVSMKQTSTGRKAILTLGGTLNINVKTGCRFIEMEGGSGLTSNAVIDGVATIGNDTVFNDWRLLQLSASGTLTFAPTANITFYSAFNSTNGCININTTNGGTVNLINKGNLTLYGKGEYSTTTPYGISLNPQATGSTATNAVFTNEGNILISGNFPGSGVYLTGAAKSGSLPVFNNSAGATLTISNSSTAATAAALGATVIGLTKIAFNNSGTAYFNATGNNSMLFGNENSIFTNTGKAVVNKAIGGNTINSSPCVVNNTGSGEFEFSLADNDAIATSVSNKLIFNNGGGTVTGKGIFAAGSFNSLTGKLSPGGSGIGLFTFSDSFLTLTGTCVLNINGTGTAGVDFDGIQSTGAVDISNANVLVNIGYNPLKSDKVNFMNATQLSGNFASVSAPAGWDTDYSASSAGLVFNNQTGIEELTQFDVTIVVNQGKIKIIRTINEPCHVKIMDMYGKVIVSQMLAQPESTIDIKNSKGVYLIKLQKQNKNFTTKIIL